MKYLIYFLLFLSPLTVRASDVLMPYGASNDFKNLEWNRYTTDNFVVLSIDNVQGKALSQNIEAIKTKGLVKWGFPDVKFSKECRIFCVSNREMLKKLFNLNEPKVEFRKDLNVAWIVADDTSVLSQIFLNEFEIQYKTLPFWFKCGNSLLSKSKIDIRKNIKDCTAVFNSEKLFSFKEEDYLKESEENKIKFNQQSLCLCLMLRKEFGEAKLQGFLRLSNKNDPQDILSFVYSFNGYESFDKQYKRFLKDLNADVINNKTPDSYLDIKSAKGKED